MKLTKITSLIISFCAFTTFAQESNGSWAFNKKLTNKQVLDSVKASFVHDNLASCIDSLWMKELAGLDLYDELTMDIKNIDVDQKVDYELPTELLKERLRKLDEKSPFNIEYNQGLENVIKSFLKNRKKSFERLMGISQYYFPIFEESLAAKNIPLEIKYLAVVESALNPRAVSRVGATGLWQFMYQTGKQYNLDISTYVDERSDPVKSSKAAAQYMTNMYNIFGDWDLVLASYNSGPGNVAKAIRRSGGKQNYWNIRQYLPKETQGYLPAFLATMYIFEYHKEHGIKPNKAVAHRFATDTVRIKNQMSFKQISDLLDISIAELQFLNPSYKREVVPAISGQNLYLRLPMDKIAVFTSNEDKIYAYVQYEASKRERPFESMYASRDSVSNKQSQFNSKVKFHKVKKGENITEISKRYGVAVNDIKKWNHLKSNKVPFGKNLKIVTIDEVANNNLKSNKSDKTELPVKETELQVKENIQSVATLESNSNNSKNYIEEKVVSYKDVVKFHKVKKGENLGSISDKYGVAISDLKKWNSLKNNSISFGKNLKIVTNEKVVSVVKKEVKTDKTSAENKTETSVALTDSKETNEENTETSNVFYTIQKGDNLFTISKKFNVSIEEIKKWNNLEDNNIKLGTKIILTAGFQNENEGIAVINNKEVKTSLNSKDNITAYRKEEFKLYYVKKGDSLFSIAKKSGISITDIKKWNGIKDGNLKPGMKLKISG